MKIERRRLGGATKEIGQSAKGKRAGSLQEEAGLMPGKRKE